MVFGKKENDTDNNQFLVLPLILSVLGSLALSLALVWMNIERTQLSYDLRQLQHSADVLVEKNARLDVEREVLLSPKWLGKKAEAMQLEPAKPGQMRRMEPVSATRQLKP